MNQEYIWSNTDFPFMCLLDKTRTLAFKNAIEAAVKSGDTVVDIGSGTGIMALFAAQAGAGKVYAVEMDHTLATALHQTAKINNFENIIEVVEGDALEMKLPANVDVVVAELIETGLIDEMQVSVMNHLIKNNVIAEKTKVIPSAYTTFIDPVYSPHEQYGFKIFAPNHDWPFFHDSAKNSWSDISIEPLTEKQQLSHLDFKKLNEPKVVASLDFEIDKARSITGVRLSGLVRLNDDQSLGATNTMNSDKVFIVEPPAHNGSVTINISYEMGKGMKSLDFGLTESKGHA